MKKNFLLATAFLFAGSATAQVSQPFQNWSENVIDEFVGISCWDLCTGDNGLVYVAATGGLFEFDGNSSRNLAVQSKTPILKALGAEGNRIYHSTLDSHGYTHYSDSLGFFQIEAMPGYISSQKFSEYNKIWVEKNSVFFLTDSVARVYTKSSGQSQIVKCLSRQTSSFVKDTNLYSYQAGLGLFVLQALQWKRVAKKVSDDDRGVRVISLFGQLVATNGSRISILNNSSGAWEPWLNLMLNDGRVTAFEQVNQYTFVVGTDQGSLYFYNRLGFLMKKVELREKGKIRSVHVDKLGTIWVATSKGLSSFQLNYPIFYPQFKNEKIASMPIYSMTGRDSLLFIGVSDELITAEHLNGSAPLRLFDKVSDIGSPHDVEIVTHGTHLFLVHTSKGLFWHNPVNRAFEKVYEGTGIHVLAIPSSKDLLLLKTNDQGIVVLSNSKGKWRYRNSIKNGNISMAGPSLVDGASGLWLIDRSTHGDSRVRHLLFDEKFERVVSDNSYGVENGLPEKIAKMRLFSSRGKILASTPRGIFTYNADTNSFELTSELTNLLGKDALDIVFEDPKGNIWFIPNGSPPGVLIKQDNGGYKRFQIPITSQQKRILDFYFLNSGVALLGTIKGIVGVNLKLIEDLPISVAIRSASSNSLAHDSLQHHNLEKSFSLPITRNSIHFTVSSNQFNPLYKASYQYRLAGIQTDWSGWRDDPYVSFPNLREGTYTFEVRAKDPFGKLSEVKTLTFDVLPPWYRTIWAYMGYIFTVALLVLSIVRWRTSAIKRYSAELEGEVSTRTEEILAQKELIEEQAKELGRLNELKTRFLTETAHELRTPLTLTLAPIYDVLDQKEQLSSGMVDQLRIAERNGRKLLELIEEILTVSRLESAALPTHQSTAFPDRVLRDLVELYKPFLIEKQIEVNYNFQTRPDLCLALDWPKYRKVISNLVHNAIKFTHNQGNIDIGISIQHKGGSEVVFETVILDTGTGISQTDLDKIFLRFYRQNDAQGGFGIGLALVKDLIELMNGTIEVSSQLGKGSTFKVQIPATIAMPIELAQTDATNISIAKPTGKNILLPKNEQKAKLVLVEDNVELRSYLVKMLSISYEVTSFENAYKALDWLEYNRTDIILSDWMMPGIDGLELYARLKASGKFRLTPFVLLTAKGGQENKLEVLKLGVDEYIAKPFAPKELLVRIDRLLQLSISRHTKPAEEIEPEEDYSLQEVFLKKLKEYVEEHIGETAIRIIDLCEVLAVSERQLHYKVKALTGMTPGNVVKEIKLQYARRLFEKQQLGTVAEGAYAIGFNNINHFSKLFEKRFGKKPSAYFKE
jgi:signal transduction histidine kinase/DNA-binding response OmpR family regulator